nr:hypothetical protein [uncultured Roseovarius sp.]
MKAIPITPALIVVRQVRRDNLRQGKGQAMARNRAARRCVLF